MMVASREAAVGLDREIEIPMPFPAWFDATVARANRQRRTLRNCDAQYPVGELGAGIEALDVGIAVMIAAINEQFDRKLRFLSGYVRSRGETKDDVDRVGALFEPDPLLDQSTGDRVSPDGNRAVETECFDVTVPARLDHITVPAIAVQWPRSLPRDQGCIRFRQHEPTTQRRVDWSNKQTMIAAGQRVGQKACPPGAEAARPPPPPALRLWQIAPNPPPPSKNPKNP